MVQCTVHAHFLCIVERYPSLRNKPEERLDNVMIDFYTDPSPTSFWARFLFRSQIETSDSPLIFVVNPATVDHGGEQKGRSLLKEVPQNAHSDFLFRLWANSLPLWKIRVYFPFLRIAKHRSKKFTGDIPGSPQTHTFPQTHASP